MNILLLYLLIGAANWIWFAARGGALLFHRRANEGPAAGIVELLFFVLLWPVQVGWQIYRGVAWLHDVVMSWLWGAGSTDFRWRKR